MIPRTRMVASYRSAAEHYLTGRPYYAPALIHRVAQTVGLTVHHRVLDLGCGPGQLAIAFAALAGPVIGIDPEPEMLRIAREQALRAGLPIEFREGTSNDLDPSCGIFRLVTIGRAFHWMDRQDTLRRLERIVEPDGAIALFGDRHPQVPDNSWRPVFDEIIDRYAAKDTARTTRRGPEWVRHEAVLLDSAFCSLERFSVIERRRTPVAHFVDRALSISSVSRDQIGARADDLALEVSGAMAPFARQGTIIEVVESEALVAGRNSEGEKAFEDQ